MNKVYDGKTFSYLINIRPSIKTRDLHTYENLESAMQKANSNEYALHELFDLKL